MRKNLHHKIMLSILAGSLALGFIYAPPAFAEEDVTIADGKTYTAPDGTQGTYNLDAEGTTAGTNYGDADGYTSITLPTGPIDKFTVIAGDGGYTAISHGSTVTGGDGGSISLSAIGNAINKGVSITAGNGGDSDYYKINEYVTGGAGGDVTLTFKNVNGNITASAGNGGYIYATYDSNGNLTGGKGGNVKLAFTNVVNGNITADAGNGGTIFASISSGNAIGGNGGDVTLTFNDIVVTDNISLKSGTNGTEYGANSTPGKGGSVTFEAESISGTQSKDSSGSTTTSNIDINLTKNDGDITFDVGTLNIADNTVKITANGNILTAAGKTNHIDTLYLTGNGDFITNLSNNADITVGKLAINDGTINDNNWKNYNNLNTTETAAEIGGDGIIFSTDSEIEWSKGLTDADNLTTPGNLTKAGEGTLILDEENENNTYDYTGLTVVEEGTLDAVATALTASKGLTLLGGATFVANNSQDWNGKQIVVYDNGSDNSAVYQGNLTATSSNLYFIASGDNTNPLLSVTGSADISGSKYNIGFTGKTTFDEGQTLTLIEADGTIDASGLQQGNGIDGIDDIKIGSTITQSITDVTTVPEVASNGSKLIATLGSTLATDEASVLNASMLGGLAFNLQGADLIAREGMEAAVRSAQLDNNHAVFAALTRSSLDYGTVDVDGTNMLAGLAWRSTTGAGSLTYGVFAEHGDGSYDTYANINGTSLHGEGDTDYTGGGILARMDFNGSKNGHGYLEASGRVGNADTDYTNSGLRDAYGRAASYSTDGTYYGAHIGAGYVQKLDEKSSIDWYGKLLWARLEGGSADLSTGEHLTFDDADSLRLRIGGRWNYAASDFVNYYAGLGYEYEFDGEASGFTNGLALGDEDLTGGSGVAELGISFKPSKNSPFSLELNLAGFTGEREGFRGGVEAVYTF